ncbi:MAG: hypothetical protein E7295_02485 [Lachnospiraceae bacterium]|nr:hypothetical protein [Lachnospiraceae bacterium]
MILRKLFLLFLGCTYGFLSAAGVFTVLAAVGLVPRFAGRTHTANRVWIYEEMVIWGTLFGCFVSVFEEKIGLYGWLAEQFPMYVGVLQGGGKVLLCIMGLFAGMFVGCLALAIAEMLDSIPILARRISFHGGIFYAIFSMALGKLAGSLFYFLTEFHATGE